MPPTKTAARSRSNRGTRASRNARPKPHVSGAVPFQPLMTPAQTRESIARNLGARVRLADYRPTVTQLTMEERERLIDQAQLMLEQVFVHLPLKRALHGTDPIQRLRLLKLR